MDRVTAAVALGSNLGDRHAHLRFAIAKLSRLLDEMRLSNIRETEPVGVGVPQSMFLNAAVVGITTLPARALLDALLAIEAERGRERPFPDAPRTLDLDLILYGDAVVDEPGLQIPHPRFRGRRFVLEPLNEIAPALPDPVTGRTIDELYWILIRGTGTGTTTG